MTENLTDFFRTKQAQAVSAHIDWSRRKAEWLAAVEELYKSVCTMLSDAVSKNVVQISRRPKQIVEEHIGPYEVDELLLSVGDELVVFSPKGRNVFGAAGRVDVRGEVGEAMLVVQPGPRWAMVESIRPSLKVVELNDTTLAEMLHAVMRR